jgi:membrane fusion protein (multidrug efflux system)
MDGTQFSAPEPISLRAPAAQTPAATAARPRHLRRNLLLGAVAVAVLAGGSVFGHDWYTHGRFIESTDDAYTQADAVGIVPRVSGYVAEAAVTDNQHVSAGDVLARIDDRDYRTALQQAYADVAAQRAQVRNIDAQLDLQQSTIAQQAADLASAQAALTFAQQDSLRYADLARNGAGSVQNAQSTASNLQQKSAALAHGRAVLQAAQQQVDVLQAEHAQAEAALAHAQAVAEQAALNLSYTVIAAPTDGAVGDRSLRVGQYVQPGTRIMDVVPTGRAIYVVANFKETQLAKMWRGERVDVALDMLPGAPLHGHVDSLSPGTGAQFALLPPENATGNFTKIVQRVPVKIVLDPADARTLEQLRPGLSVTVEVDTRLPEGVRPHTLVEREDTMRDLASPPASPPVAQLSQTRLE